MSDPRMKYVPELEEERFQSIVAVPILAKSGDVIGVAVLHTEAPREFDDDVLNFLVHTASLVAGAIENAQLYEDTRRRVQALTTLARLSQALAAVTIREDLYDVVTRGARELLRADACQIYRLDVEADELALAGSDPAGSPAPSPRPGGAALVLDLMRRSGNGRGGRRRVARALWPDLDENALLVAPLVARDEQLGVLCCLAQDRQFSEEDAELLGAVADQTAVGLKKAELIERLTAENIVKDMFDALAAGSAEAAAAKASEARCDLSLPHVFLHVEPARGVDDASPAWPELSARLESRLRRLCPRAFFDSRHDRLRALAPLSGEGPAVTDELREACEPLAVEEGVVVGLSDLDRGAASARRRMREAADAARIGRSLVVEGGAVCYQQLGAYRYLVHLERDQAPRDRYRESVEALAEYDRRRGASLVETLEQYLADRGSVTASRPGALRASEHRPPAARSDRARRRPRSHARRTCSRSSSRSSSPGCTVSGTRVADARSGGSLLAPGRLVAPAREPGPEDPEPDHVEQDHEQHPPRLPQERHVLFLAELVAGQVGHHEQGHDQDRGSCAREHEEDHRRGDPTGGGAS